MPRTEVGVLQDQRPDPVFGQTLREAHRKAEEIRLKAPQEAEEMIRAQAELAERERTEALAAADREAGSATSVPPEVDERAVQLIVDAVLGRSEAQPASDVAADRGTSRGSNDVPPPAQPGAASDA